MEAFLALVAAAAGVGLKVVWDSYVKQKSTIELEVWKIRATQLERRLSQFYWPIYLRLQRDNLIWREILPRFDRRANEDKLKLAHQIDEGVLLQNHLEILKIIEENIHLADLDSELESSLMAYVRHVDVFRSLRALGINKKDPIAFGEPYPKEFFNALEARLQRYQAEYDALIHQRGIGDKQSTTAAK